MGCSRVKISPSVYNLLNRPDDKALGAFPTEENIILVLTLSVGFNLGKCTAS